MAYEPYIAPGAAIVGDVMLEEDTSVWFQAVLRADTDAIRIGKGSNIQDNCTLHTDSGHPVILGENVTVGHNAIVHGCTVGDRTVVGMGSIILNGAVVGADCIIGAGAVVTGKMHIPDGSLVLGTPAKIIRPTTEEERAHNLANAGHYTRLAQEYREGKYHSSAPDGISCIK